MYPWLKEFVVLRAYSTESGSNVIIYCSCELLWYVSLLYVQTARHVRVRSAATAIDSVTSTGCSTHGSDKKPLVSSCCLDCVRGRYIQIWIVYLIFKCRIKSHLHLLALLGAHLILHVSRIRIKLRLFSKSQKI